MSEPVGTGSSGTGEPSSDRIPPSSTPETPLASSPDGDENAPVDESANPQKGWISRHKILTGAGIAAILVSFTATGASLGLVAADDLASSEDKAASAAPVQPSASPTPVPAPVQSSASSEPTPTKTPVAESPSESSSTSDDPVESSPTTQALSSSDKEDKADVNGLAKDLVQDIKRADKWLLDGIDVDQAFDTMSQTFDSLSDAAAPPQVKADDYYAMTDTSSDFMSDASDMYDDDAMEATTKYLAVRAQVQKRVLDPINDWLGTGYSIPPSTYPTPSG